MSTHVAPVSPLPATARRAHPFASPVGHNRQIRRANNHKAPAKANNRQSTHNAQCPRHFAFSAAHITLPDEDDQVWQEISDTIGTGRHDITQLALDLDDLLNTANDIREQQPNDSGLDSEVTAIRNLREELRKASARIQSFRDSYSQNRPPNSRVRFTDRTTSLNDQEDMPSPINSENTGDEHRDQNPFAFAGSENADANIASHLNSGNNASGFSSMSFSSSELFKRLSKSAYTFNIEKLSYENDPRLRRKNFLTCIDTLKEVTQTNEATDSLLDGSPSIVPTDVPEAVDRVMAQLIKAYLTKN